MILAANTGYWGWLSQPRHGWELAAFIVGALGIGVLALGLLCSTPPRYRKGVVMAVTFIGGLFLSVEFLYPGKSVLTTAMPSVANGQIVVGSFALMLGILNLFQIHGKAMRKRSTGWYNSAAFFVAFFSIMIAGFMRDARPEGAAAGIFGILFSGFMMSLQSTTFSLIAFYIVSAAYRAFRIRSAEAVLMMLTAAIVMLALVPVGVWITDWIPRSSVFAGLRLERMGYWLLVSPNMAAQRAIGFGVAVGALATGLRIWLSLERGSFFDRQL